ncbi:MAG TPA: MauE/DoxX family redox-associated membrane protein [Mycobacteriales bacterium]|nr:MauE/DoxX family redox-associated membrane protein [Mycobacteriales bacterium]
MPRLRAASPYLLAGLLGGAGVLHFAVPGFFDRIVPPFLGPPRPWTYASGVAELAVAAAVAVPRTRRAGATAAAVLLVAVFPANVYQAFEPGDVPRWVALARLPLQVPLVLWALQVRRATARRR